MVLQIREYHRKHPVARVVDANDDYETVLKEEPQIEFSGEVSLSPPPSFFVFNLKIINKECWIHLVKFNLA